MATMTESRFLAQGLVAGLVSQPAVIPGLDPGIHARGVGVDGRDKPGHDGLGASCHRAAA
ncbi:hypothetical protein SLNSH_16745 [Alsobacter soli]|uniref:Uncharacterized protein n=1 Tax=Alsobacter soli TaxID=2109933 RepID=A0A2T1HQJ2_9HYPH|nr:hypothetical protein [Alsobacter soli]PSC03913.1 hypothetical protein SLNSH_16745 [Alsobacter soli]